MASQAILELRSVSSCRGDYTILDAISLVAMEGEATYFMGSAGSGKSVMLKTAAGIQIPTKGEVLFRGRELSRMSRHEEAEFRKRTGFVFQDAALWANQSLYDNLALPLHIHEPALSATEMDKAIRRAADLVGYSDDLRVRPAELSLGERRLIGLARAVVLDPELLFMDEPAANLDEEAADRVFDIVAALKERGRSILVASSRSDAVSRFADRVGVLRGGKLIAYGSLDEAAAWRDPAVRSVTGRLRSRQPVEKGEGISSLAWAWAEALAEDKPVVTSGAESGEAARETSSPGGEEGITLGDIINDVAGDAGAQVDGGAGRSDGKEGGS